MGRAGKPALFYWRGVAPPLLAYDFDLTMQNLVTRFHALLLSVTVAITAVAFLRIPAGFTFPAHWQGSTMDWLWPRDLALLAAPLLQLALMAVFFALGRASSPNQFARSQHILDPALTLLMLVVAACQLGLLLIGIGSDLDIIRFVGFALGATLLLLGFVLFGAERHTYAGMRMPWPIASDRGWRVVHRIAGVAFAATGSCLAVLAWTDPGPGPVLFGLVGALIVPSALAGLASLMFRV